MSTLINQLKIVELLENAFTAVSFAAKEEQKITHNQHLDQAYAECLAVLGKKLTREQVLLRRAEITGK